MASKNRISLKTKHTIIQQNDAKSSNLIDKPNAYKSALSGKNLNHLQKEKPSKQISKFSTITAPATYKRKRSRSKSKERKSYSNEHNFKELELKYNELLQKHTALSSQMGISHWKWFDIYHFIIGLNIKQMHAYKQDLFDNLRIHLIDGKYLKILSCADWNELGIKDEECCRALVHCIQNIETCNDKKKPVQQKDDAVIDVMTRQHFISQQIQITSLQQQLQTNRAQQVNQTTTIQRELIKYKQALSAERQKYENLYKSFNSLQENHDSLQMKHALLDSKCMEMEQQMKRMKVQKKKEEEEDEKYDGNNDKNADWKQWDHNDVYLWILSLNGGYFEKYKDIYNNLKMEKIDGSCLNALDKADIHRIGVVEFKDKLLLIQNLKKLCK